MELDFAGSPIIHAPRAAVWERLIDMDFIASCATGVDGIDPVDDRRFRVHAVLRFGFIKFRFQVMVEQYDLDRPNSAKMKADGHAVGARATAVTSVQLDELADGRTHLHWHASAEAHGTLAKIGAHFLRGTAQEILEDFWAEFVKRAPAADHA